MKAFAIAERGQDPEVQEVQTKTPGAGEVTVAIDAASINGFDTSVAAGYVWDHMAHNFPVVLGRDFVGRVDAIGEGVTEFQPDDRVAGVITGLPLGAGGIGESITVPSSLLVQVPDGVSSEDAAAVGLAAITALDLVDALEIKEGETVLISGATGGVGLFAVQLASQRGGRVIATAHPGEGQEVSRSLGASETVDYSGDLVAVVKAIAADGVDKVAHAAGDPGTVGMTLRPGGVIASVVGANAENVSRQDVTVISVMAKPTADKLSHLLEKLAVGRLQVHVATSISLDHATEAMTAFLANKIGKVLIITT